MVFITYYTQRYSIVDPLIKILRFKACILRIEPSFKENVFMYVLN